MPLDDDTSLISQACRQMRPHLSPLSDGNLRGFWAWYARIHIGQCARCTAVLNSLIELRKRLAALRPSAHQPNAEENPLLFTEALVHHAEHIWQQSKNKE